MRSGGRRKAPWPGRWRPVRPRRPDPSLRPGGRSGTAGPAGRGPGGRGPVQARGPVQGGPVQGGPVQGGEHARSDLRRPGAARLGPAEFQLVLEVFPAVTGHRVQEHQPAARDPGLTAGQRARQGHHQVAGAHQLGDTRGKAERVNAGRTGRQGLEPGREAAVTAGHRQHVHAGRGQGARGPLHRPQPPSAAHEQDAPGVRRYPERRPGLRARPQVGEGGPYRRRDHADPGPGQVAAHPGRPGRRGHQEQVDAGADPRGVRQGVGAEHDGTRPRPGPAEFRRGRDTRREHADDQVGGFAVEFAAESGDQPRRGGPVHGRGHPAARAQMGEVQPVEDPRHGHQPAEDPAARAAGARAQQPHAVQGPAVPAETGQAGRDHLGDDVMAQAQGAGEDHRASRHRPAPPRFRHRLVAAGVPSLAPGRWPYPAPRPRKRPRAAQARFARYLVGNLTRVPEPTGPCPCPAGAAA